MSTTTTARAASPAKTGGPSKKAAAPRTKKAAVAAAPDPVEPDEVPLVVFDDDDFANSEQVFVFELDGTRYYAPRRPAAGIALGYLRLIREQREDVAYGWVIEQLFGRDVYDVLVTHPTMSETGLAKVIAACQQLLRVGPGPKVSPTSRRTGTGRRRG